jgi:multiple sugar transport system substrate-binding protein
MALRRHSKTELSFWVMPNAGFATRPLLQSLVDEFEASRPDVKVRLVIHPWSLAWNRFMEVIKGRNVKTAPDVLQVGTTWVTTLSYLGALEKVPADAGLDDTTGATLGDATPHCVPWFIDIRVLYYRKDLFARLGVDPRWLEDWKGFNRACAEVKKAIDKGPRLGNIIAPLAIPGQKPGVLMHDLAPWVWQSGGDFGGDESGETNLTQTALQGCAFYFDLVANGYMPIPNSAVPPGNFFTGHYAMQFTGSWPVDTYLNPLSPYANAEVAKGFGVAPLPAGPQGRYTFLGGSNLGVAAASQNKEAAWDFIKFLNEPRQQIKHARSIGALPARLPPARLQGMDSLFQNAPEAHKVFLDSFNHARRLPPVIELGSVEQIVYKMGARLLSLIREGAYNHKRLQQEIAAANGEIKALLSVHRYGTRTVERAA